jgi:hypothetical protein
LAIQLTYFASRKSGIPHTFFTVSWSPSVVGIFFVLLLCIVMNRRRSKFIGNYYLLISVKHLTYFLLIVYCLFVVTSPHVLYLVLCIKRASGLRWKKSCPLTQGSQIT